MPLCRPTQEGTQHLLVPAMKNQSGKKTKSIFGSTRPVPQSPGSQINKAGSNRDNRTPEDQREGCGVGKPLTSALAGS